MNKNITDIILWFEAGNLDRASPKYACEYFDDLESMADFIKKQNILDFHFAGKEVISPNLKVSTEIMFGRNHEYDYKKDAWVWKGWDID